MKALSVRFPGREKSKLSPWLISGSENGLEMIFAANLLTAYY
jgi:hypothetical protein